MTYDFSATETALAVAGEASAALDAAAADAGNLARARESTVAMDRLVAAIAAGDEERRDALHCCLAARWDAAEAGILMDAAVDRAAKSAAQKARQRRHQEAVLASLDEAIAAAEAEATVAEAAAKEARERVVAEEGVLRDIVVLNAAIAGRRGDECLGLTRSVAARLGVSSAAAEEAIRIGIIEAARRDNATSRHNDQMNALIAEAQGERAKQVAIRDADDGHALIVVDDAPVSVPLSRQSFGAIIARLDGSIADPPDEPIGLDAGLIDEPAASRLERELLRAAAVIEAEADRLERPSAAEEAAVSAAGERATNRLVDGDWAVHHDVEAVLDGIDRILAAVGFGPVKPLVISAAVTSAERSNGPPAGSDPDDALDFIPLLPEPLTEGQAIDLVAAVERIRKPQRVTNAKKTRTGTRMGSATRLRMTAIQAKITDEERKP